MSKVKSFVSWLRMSKLRLGGAIVLLLLGGFGLVQVVRGKNTQAEFQTAKVERGTIVSTISASGHVLVANIMSLTTSATGVVANVYVKDGDIVTAGQKIADIIPDSPGAQKSAAAWSSYLTAKTTLDSATSTQYSLQSDMFTKWKTYMDLAQSSSYQNPDGSPRVDTRALPQFYSPYDDWLAAEAKYKNQQAVITQTKAAVSSAWYSYAANAPTISASQAGKITNLTIVPGMTLATSTDTSGQRIAVIEQTGTPILSVTLSEIDVPKVSVGQKATVALDSIPEKTFTGKILTVDRIGAVSSGVTSYPVTVQLDLSVPEILPNMAASASIITASKSDVLLVPSAAIQSQGGQMVVRVLRGGREVEIPVGTGLTSDTQTEVTSGLTETDEVITGTINASQTQRSSSVFGGGFGNGVFRPGGLGGGGGGRRN